MTVRLLRFPPLQHGMYCAGMGIEGTDWPFYNHRTRHENIFDANDNLYGTLNNILNTTWRNTPVDGIQSRIKKFEVNHGHVWRSLCDAYTVIAVIEQFVYLVQCTVIYVRYSMKLEP